MGSSPLARGLRRRRARRRCCRRIIPARAGFTDSVGPGCSANWDHPRSRGVYSSFQVGIFSIPGSSPLARGLLNSRALSYLRVRIIPARAGFTAALDEERACPCGSSPLARGLPFRTRCSSRRSRIIPARAGFTTAAVRASISVPGSSPLARGLRRRRPADQPGHRIIPARAGFTLARLNAMVRGPDHPRSRGVYGLSCHDSLLSAGSSPLARGLLDRVPRVGDAVRIIPARAGFTGCMGTPRGCSRDHPRSRGVYCDRSDDGGVEAGSSPLARGLRYS